MPNKKLTWQVEVDANGAVRDLRRLGQEGERAGQEMADGFTDANRALDKLDANADSFDGISSSSKRAVTGLDDVTRSAGSSRSALANMVGNTSQDAFVGLGGAAGSAGVAIGQMAEYMADASFEGEGLSSVLKNFAGVLGPMAALAAAGLLVNKVMGDMAKVSESEAKRLDVFTQAAIDGTDAFDALAEQVAETGELTFEDDGLFGSNFGATVQNIVNDLATLGLSLEDFQRLVEDPGAEQAMRELLDEWMRTDSVGTVAATAMVQVLDAVDAYQESAAEGAEAAADINAVLGDTGPAAAAAAAALDEARESIADLMAEPFDLSGALAGEMDKVDAIFEGLAFDVNFETAMADALKGLDGFGPDLRTIADSWADILSGKDLSILGNVRADDAEALAALNAVTTLFQEGVVNAFDQGGTDAAQAFVDANIAAISEASGLSEAEVFRLMGLPPSGNVDLALVPHIDEVGAARAGRILDVLAGVSDDPRIARIQIEMEQGTIRGEIADLAAQLLAYEFGVGVKPEVNETTTAAEIQYAQQLLDNQLLSVPVGADTEPAKRDIDDMVRKVRTAKVGVETPDASKRKTDLDNVAKARTATIDTQPVAQLVHALLLNALLDNAARPRTVSIGVNVTGLATANALIDQAARDRSSTIDVYANTYAAQQAIATAIASAARLGRMLS